LLIRLNVVLNNTFIQTLTRNLERLYDLGLTKATLSRNRRAIIEKMFPLNHYGRNILQLINKDFNTPKQIANGRFRRQTTNETRVKVRFSIFRTCLRDYLFKEYKNPYCIIF
jgi:hypothetical protein